ncbi:hypothetical protein N7520_003664 [Penicillium odoratum]|uniref:uncharacterized protein n=1 Tax=Penicillium odoratum TaxID=1167516 RepID=UPI0025481894|nr:uncharacterized protein N7520_003664 [Penicillium odoratum]KAJ5769105.1 hypothetical protein N7520_003664 [Penicillium odoratum]
MTANASEALDLLLKIQNEQGDLKQNLSIIRIAEPISDAGDANPSPSKRRSDVSLSNLNDPTPASLEADLTHYKVTKEKFLRAIVGDPPLIVGHNENVELETQLAEVKAELKARKEEARMVIEEMEKMSRDLASRYKNVEVQEAQLASLPESIENLEGTIAGLRAKQVANMDTSDPRASQNLSLPATVKLLADREAELAALNRQMAAVQNSLPRKSREAEAIERECSVLERRKVEAVAQAREARRKKQEGETDGTEEMGRWYRSAEETLKEMVGVEG